MYILYKLNHYLNYVSMNTHYTYEIMLHIHFACIIHMGLYSVDLIILFSVRPSLIG